MSSFTRAESVEASYSLACCGVGATGFEARVTVDSNKKQESAQKTVRIFVVVFTALMEGMRPCNRR